MDPDTAADRQSCRVSDEYTMADLISMVGRYAPTYGFSKVYLFGSRARGDYRDGSDYDFCVVPGDDTDLLSLSGFLMDMEDNLGKGGQRGLPEWYETFVPGQHQA